MGKGFPGNLTTPTHSYTKNIKNTVQADIIITALCPNYLKAKYGKRALVVIVAYTRPR
jgi:hypothetical protein